MIDELEKKTSIAYISEIGFEREDIGNTNLESGVALPHADQRRFLSLIVIL